MKKCPFNFFFQIDPVTLNTLQRVDLNKTLGVFSHASHPHYDESGNMLTIGMRVGYKGPEYVVSKIPVSFLFCLVILLHLLHSY